MRLLPDFYHANLSNEEVAAMMFADGISYQEIANYITWDRKQVSRYLSTFPQRLLPTQYKLKTEGNTVVCYICHKRVLPESLPFRKHNGLSLYVFSYCHSCAQVNPDENPLAYNSLAKKLARKEKTYRAEKKSTLEQIPYGYFSFLFLKQKGVCYYTDKPLEFQVRANLRDTLSVDRVIYNGSYEQGNIVFATNQINVMKSDLTLKEMRQWSPLLHQRTKRFIKNSQEYKMEGSNEFH